MGVQLLGVDLARLRHRLDVEFHKPFPMYNWLVNHEKFPNETKFFVDCWPSFRVVLARTEIQNNKDYIILFAVNTGTLDDSIYDGIPGSYMNIKPTADIHQALTALCRDPAVVNWKRHVVFDYVDSSLWFVLESIMRRCGGVILNKQEARYVYTATKDSLILELPPDMARVVQGQPEGHPDIAKYVFLNTLARVDYRVLLRDKRTSCCLLNDAETNAASKCVGLATATLLGDFVPRSLVNMRPGEGNAYLPVMYSLVASSLFSTSTVPAFTLPAHQKPAEHFMLRSLGFSRMASGNRLIRVRQFSSFVDDCPSRHEKNNFGGRICHARRVLEFDGIDAELGVFPFSVNKACALSGRRISSTVFRQPETATGRISRSILETRRSSESLITEFRRRCSENNEETHRSAAEVSEKGSFSTADVSWQGEEATQPRNRCGLCSDCYQGANQIGVSTEPAADVTALNERRGLFTPVHNVCISTREDRTEQSHETNFEIITKVPPASSDESGNKIDNKSHNSKSKELCAELLSAESQSDCLSFDIRESVNVDNLLLADQKQTKILSSSEHCVQASASGMQTDTFSTKISQFREGNTLVYESTGMHEDQASNKHDFQVPSNRMLTDTIGITVTSEGIQQSLLSTDELQDNTLNFSTQVSHATSTQTQKDNTASLEYDGSLEAVSARNLGTWKSSNIVLSATTSEAQTDGTNSPASTHNVGIFPLKTDQKDPTSSTKVAQIQTPNSSEDEAGTKEPDSGKRFESRSRTGPQVKSSLSLQEDQETCARVPRRGRPPRNRAVFNSAGGKDGISNADIVPAVADIGDSRARGRKKRARDKSTSSPAPKRCLTRRGFRS